MAPTIGRVALDNGFHGSIPGDWVAPPPQNIQKLLLCLDIVMNPLFRIDFSISDSLKIVRKSVLIYETIIPRNLPILFEIQYHLPKMQLSVHTYTVTLPYITFASSDKFPTACTIPSFTVSSQTSVGLL